MKEYFELLCPGRSFPFYFTRRDHRGDLQLGREKTPDGLMPIIKVDGPHSAPAEHYSSYGTVMLVGAGIGLTPCASILTALTRYRWKKNYPPEILHFYWVVRHNEVESFQWLVHLLTGLFIHCSVFFCFMLALFCVISGILTVVYMHCFISFPFL